MTGEGTAESPFIFTSWHDLCGSFNKSIVTDISAYFFKAAEGIEEDLGETYGNDDAETLDLSFDNSTATAFAQGVFIFDFNGMVIKNGRFSTMFLTLKSSRYNSTDRFVIKNLHCKNCEITTAFTIPRGSDQASSNKGPILFNECVFELYTNTCGCLGGGVSSIQDYYQGACFRNCYVKLMGGFNLVSNNVFHDSILQLDVLGVDSRIHDTGSSPLSSFYDVITGVSPEPLAGQTSFYIAAARYLFVDSYVFGRFNIETAAGYYPVCFGPNVQNSLIEVECPTAILAYETRYLYRRIVNKDLADVWAIPNMLQYCTAATTEEIRTPGFLYEHGLPAQP